MENDPYRKLQKHLDDLPVGYPATKSGVEIRILKHIFTPEEAELACKLTFFPILLEDIYGLTKRLVKSPQELAEKLEAMAKKGGIFRARKDNDVYYSNAILAVGMFEYQVKRLSKEFILDFKEYLDTSFFKEGLKSTPNQLRTIPIEQAIPNENFVAAYDDISKILKTYSGTLAVTECICRKQNKMLGKGCDHTIETCILFSPGSDFYLENKMGRKITNDEALTIVKQSQEEGLVLQPGNTITPYCICCCCGCCCEMLTSAKKLAKPVEFLISNYYAVVNDDCTGCKACEERCQMDAIVVNDEGKAKVNLDRCIGCGVCVPTCPSSAICLKQKEKVTQPPKSLKYLYLEIGSSKNQKKAQSS